MLHGGLQPTYLKAFAVLATTAIDSRQLRNLAAHDQLKPRDEVLARRDKYLMWSRGVVTKVDNGKVGVRVGPEQLTDLPPTKALIVREAGVGALMRMAAAVGNGPLVDALIKEGVGVLVADAMANTPLHLAAAAGHAHVCRALVAKGADATVANQGSQTASDLARTNKHLAVMRLFNPTLSDNEFTVEACAASPRLVAAAAGDVVMLSEAGAKDEGPRTALMIASRAAKIEVVEALLRTASDGLVNAQSASGCTALFLAAETGDEHITRLLLRHRANVMLVTSDGSTPMHGSSSGGHVECVIALMEARADVDPANNAGCTPLMSSAEYGHDQVASLEPNPALIVFLTSR